MQILIPLYTGAANSVLQFCDNKTSQVAVEGTNDAERLPWSFKGGTEDVQITQWTPKFADEVGRSQIAQRRQEEGTRIAVVADCLHTIVQRPLSDHCGDHCASIRRPRHPWAIMAMALHPIRLLCTTCWVTTTVLVVQGTHKGRAAAVTKKQNFLGLGDHLASRSIFWWIKGGTKVATLCKGGFIAVMVLRALRTRCSTFVSDRSLELCLKVIVSHMCGKHQEDYLLIVDYVNICTCVIWHVAHL